MATTVTLELPDKTAQQLAQVAHAQRVTMAAVVQHLLDEQQTILTPLPQDVESELEALHYLSSDLLRLVAQNTLSPTEQKRLAELNHLQQSAAGLTAAEQAEQKALLDFYNRTLVRRATAIDLLRQRGEAWQMFVSTP